LLGPEAVESNEDPYHHLFGDTTTSVAHLDPQGPVTRPLPGDFDFPSLPVVLDGIGQEVQENLREALTVSRHVQPLGVLDAEVDAPLSGEWLNEACRFLKNVCDGHGF